MAGWWRCVLFLFCHLGNIGVFKDWLASLLFWSPALEQLHLPYSWLNFFHFWTCALSLDLESMLLDGRVYIYTKEDRIPYLLAGLFESQD